MADHHVMSTYGMASVQSGASADRKIMGLHRLEECYDKKGTEILCHLKIHLCFICFIPMHSSRVCFKKRVYGLDGCTLYHHLLFYLTSNTSMALIVPVKARKIVEWRGEWSSFMPFMKKKIIFWCLWKRFLAC